ncbi:oxidative stress-induced growth inhibitor 2-like isoform X2 [Toxorhynchites rutilus septentrionalis]|uniref:oxidative stress-induced growth inhibitor 2-like isoform X2 n=1 Tax=Toxorhynchites rutilus septentrionalis TaxID=329112 RepID=UPI0024786533|nr:oxidative stress-induced growth inhibitor 2-like isoform X2 [Toxorhynchites rutilus septentrionalis]XP_055620688.1 oxidative stress-induced growth inhibitor 2-like isoform X2 [Toxorhynchites rutilus septentrionalis]XP_055620689.1 oxidative stress-induced growth inhibitor 2-like isoform X2 [Toxorhynchites rutilus septentrionalis]XP_055620690.1 oxidative stress-induced growth inhibitor 2-like isoform X2 [Toxorhynchites rutilus septentrionalis]
MKDITATRSLIYKDTLYKDVVVIGNGPSGISLSYMLAGNWPYWSLEKIQKHPDELLRARLNYYDADKSLVEHDLFSLADGLEGRSTNPVSLLVGSSIGSTHLIKCFIILSIFQLDSLQHPCADLGMELPCMVDYKYHPVKEIDHLVLGRGPPGGSWHRMDPSLRTLSLAAWMSLPGLPFADWEKSHPPTIEPAELIIDGSIQSNIQYQPPVDGVKILKQNQFNGASNNRSRKILIDSSNVNSSRDITEPCAKCGELYRQQSQQHQKVSLMCSRCHFRNTLTENQNNIRQQQSSVVYDERNGRINVKLYPPRRILSLKRQLSKEVETRALISRVAKYYESYVQEMNLAKYFMNDVIVTTVVPLDVSSVGGSVPEKLRSGRWIVSGFNRITNKQFTVVCRNLVMANGASDLANRLGVKGEGLEMPWVKYELPHLERALEKYDDETRSQLKPVLIVGAGLSAADAVTICRSSGIPVIHVYRNRTAGLDKILPGNVYPEYHEVHRMMKDSSRKYDLYTALPEHTIADLSQSAYHGSSDSHRVIVQHLKSGERREIEVSFCAILIGSRPDLRFAAGLTKDSAQHHNVQVPFAKEQMTMTESRVDENQPVQPSTFWSFTEQLLASRFGRKFFWLKNICAKCRHLNVCERSRYKHYQQPGTGGAIDSRRNANCNHHHSILGKKCECTLPTAAIVGDHANGAGLGLGEDPTKPIDCKSNPIDVDKYTNAVQRSPHRGLYAMGPLVGDNFVRFIPGGALTITSALHKLTEND